MNAVFCVATLIRGRRLLEGGSYSDLIVNGVALMRGQRLIEFPALIRENTVPFLLFYEQWFAP